MSLDHTGVWIVVAAIAIGWTISIVTAVARAARRLAAPQARLAATLRPVPAPSARSPFAATVQTMPRPRATRPPAAAPVAVPAAGRGLAELLADPQGARAGIILGEVLGPPLSLR